jgi:hypothetical protein
MQLTQEEMDLRDILKDRINILKQKIDTLPSFLKEEIILEYKIVEDYMRDKFCRSGFRRNKIRKLEERNANREEG